MTYTEILELIRAGYSKAEIDSMISAAPAPEGATVTANPPESVTPAPAPESTPAESPAAPDPAPAPTPAAPSEAEKLLAALGMKLDRLATAIHSANVGGIENSTPQETTESIIAKIINPYE